MRQFIYRVTSLFVALVFLITPLAAQQRRQSVPKRPPAAPAPEPVPTFDTLLASGSYNVYSEVRNVGALIYSPGANELIDPLVQLGKPPKEFKTLLKWLKAHADALAGSRMMAASWPARSGLPSVLLAVEFSSAEEAKKFYPELRDFLPTLVAPPTPVETPSKAPASADGGKQNAEGGIGIRTAEGNLYATEQIIASRAEDQTLPSQPPYYLKQTGSLILITPAPFDLRELRPRGSVPLVEDQNFIVARNRFASEPVFVFVDLKSMEKEEKTRRQKWEAEAEKRAEAVVADPLKVEELPTEVLPEPSEELPPPPAPAPSIVPEREVTEPESEPKRTATLSGEPPAGVNLSFLSLYGLLFGGGETRWPEALGAALVLDGDAYVVRALIVNSAENKNNAIPFVPLFVPGPAMVPQSPNVFPADTDLFVSASFDFPQIYEEMLKAITSKEAQARKFARIPASMSSPTSPFAFYEKKLGLKIKDDLLPLLGNEIALALPRPPKVVKENPATPGPEGNEPKPRRPPEPIPVLAIAVKDREAVKRLIPKIIEGLGFKGANLVAQTEKRDTTELTSYAGQFAYAFINDFLILSPDPNETRRVVDAYLNHQTLSSDSHFRNSTQWQPRQLLGQVYTGPGLVETYFFGARGAATAGNDKLGDFMTRVSPVIDPMTYSLSNDGGGPLHELHVPKNLVQMIIAGASSQSNPSPLQTNESMARAALYSLASSEASFKNQGGNYGTLEELEEKNFIKDLSASYGYRIDVVLSGNSFQATAVPIEYGKTGRLSFFIDESGILRGGDHGGGAATVSDDPFDSR